MMEITIERVIMIMRRIKLKRRKRKAPNQSQNKRIRLFQRKPSIIAVQNNISASVRGK